MKTVKHYKPIPCPENDRTAAVVHAEMVEAMALLTACASTPSTAPANRESALTARERAVALLNVLFLAKHVGYGAFILSLCHIDSLYEQAVGVVRATARKRKTAHP